MIALVCPRCQGPLAEVPVALTCLNCGREYPRVDGIPCFASADTFYEGKWAEPDLSTGSLRNRLVKKERFFVHELASFRRQMRINPDLSPAALNANTKGARQVAGNLPFPKGEGTTRAERPPLRDGTEHNILDLGCGGGWRAFATAGYSVGVDVSVSSLRAAQTVYDQVAQAELSALPFGDNSFDLVVSSDVLGHVPCEGKDAVLREIYRVLRPGGRTLHYVEAEGDDPFMRFARQHPELYERYVITPEGHIGLEMAGQIAARFANIGFSVAAAKPCYRGLTYTGRFVQYFDNEYRRQSGIINAFVGVCKLATAIAPLEMASNIAMSLLIELGDLILPATWAGGLLISCEKPV